MVAAGTGRGVPERGPDPYPGRLWWNEWLPMQGVEAEPPGEALRPAWADGHRLPLPAGVLQVEPDRIPAVQPDQHQLGRPPAAVPGGDARVHPRHEYEDRADRNGRAGRGDVPERPGGVGGGGEAM